MLHDALTAAASLLLPPGLVFLFLAVGLVVCRFLNKKWTISIVSSAIVLAWITATPALAKVLMAWHVSDLTPLTRAQLAGTSFQKDTAAIAVLGLGEVSKGREYGQYSLRSESYERLRYAIYLSRAMPLALLYSGGQLSAEARGADPLQFSEAAVASRTARTDFNAALKWTDAKSITVRESAKQVSAILQPENIRTVYLVAHAWKLPRAIQAYEAAGLTVIPAPVDFPDKTDFVISDFFPTSEGTRWVRNVVRERLGMFRGQT